MTVVGTTASLNRRGVLRVAELESILSHPEQLAQCEKLIAEK